MSLARRARSLSFVASAIAVVSLFATTGCGFCVFSFTCPAGDCCREFRCYEPKDCPAMLAKPANRDALAQSEQCGEDIDPSVD